MKSDMHMNVKKLTELALMTALALIIFVVELQIPNPVPIPGAKLGLANIITVFAIYHYRAKEVFMLLIARIALGAVFSGNIMALIYSLSGGMACLSGMLLLKRVIPPNYIWLCSVFGAVFHNVGQTMMACMMAGWGILLYMPFLLTSGCIAGAFTGACAQIILARGLHQNQGRYKM